MAGRAWVSTVRQADGGRIHHQAGGATRAPTPPDTTKFRAMDSIVYRELFPGVRSLSADQLVASLDLVHDDERVKRPYTIVTFVSSVDGRTAVEGRSRGLSDAGDRELHRTLRERADAVLAGTGTMAAENYGRMLPAKERRPGPA